MVTDLLCAGHRTRLHVLLRFHAALLLAAATSFPITAPAFVAHGVAASAASFVFWAALWHVTAGVALPALIALSTEACERRQFLAEEAAAAGGGAAASLRQKPKLVLS